MNLKQKYETFFKLLIATGMTASMTEEQKKLFADFLDAQRELNILTDIETFIYAFRLGAKIMLDVLTEGKMKEI